MENNKPAASKITKSQLFGYIKECIKEMAKSGELNVILSEANVRGMIPAPMMYQPQPQMQYQHVYPQPMAQIAPGNPVLNQLLNDTAVNSLQEHMANEPPTAYQHQMAAQQPQQMNYQPAYQNGQPQPQYYQNNAPMQQPQRNAGYTTNWAKLALSSPISNRPTGGATNPTSLPGVRTGKFD